MVMWVGLVLSKWVWLLVGCLRVGRFDCKGVLVIIKTTGGGLW